MARPGLKCKPVAKTQPPVYPSKLEVQELPSLLEQHIPSSWNLKPELVGAAALFLGLGIGGCKKYSESPTQSIKPEETAPRPIVAPVFRHGEGWGRAPHYFLLGGTSGRIATRYMTEEEAREIILLELNKLGVNPTESDVPVKDVQVPVLQVAWKKSWDPDNKQQSYDGYTEDRLVPLKADYVDLEKRIYIEFVSGDDHYSFLLPDPPEPNFPGEKVLEQDLYYRCFPEIGEQICQIVRTEGTENIYFGVIYDPVVSRGSRNGPAIEQQVKDLVDWLKAQGAI